MHQRVIVDGMVRRRVVEINVEPLDGNGQILLCTRQLSLQTLQLVRLHGLRRVILDVACRQATAGVTLHVAAPVMVSHQHNEVVLVLSRTLPASSGTVPVEVGQGWQEAIFLLREPLVVNDAEANGVRVVRDVRAGREYGGLQVILRPLARQGEAVCNGPLNVPVYLSGRKAATTLKQHTV